MSKNDRKLIIGGGGGVGIKMSWVEKIEKLKLTIEGGVEGGRGEGDDYSELESKLRVVCFTYL